MSFKIYKFWFPVLFYSGIIFTISSVPDLKVPAADLGLDKIYHFLEYVPLGFFLARALKGTQGRFLRKEAVLITILFCFSYAVSDELHQMFVPGRSADTTDILADTLGGLIGGLIYRHDTNQTV